MIISIPLINQFSALAQSGILAFLLVISYLNRRARYIVLGLILAYVGWRTIIPISQWAFAIFKWIAMLGFYVTYFQSGIGFIATCILAVLAYFENMQTRQ